MWAVCQQYDILFTVHMTLITWIVVFVIATYFLVKSADWFTEYAERLGLMLKMPAFLVGVVIIAIGTSLPELATSILAVLSGEGAIVLGNVFGSDITNILLGLGISAIVAKKIITTKVDIFFLDFPVFVAAILMFTFMLLDGSLNRIESLILIIGLILYFFASAHTHKEAEEAPTKLKKKKPIAAGKKPWASTIFFTLLSLVGVFLASKYVVDSVINIAELLNLGTAALAASIIALGTSLPEIMVAASAARKGKFELLAGNIIGSNVFNIVGVAAISGLIGTVTIEPGLLWILLPFLIAVNFLYWVILKDGKITRAEGGFLVLVYVVFIGKLFELF